MAKFFLICFTLTILLGKALSLPSKSDKDDRDDSVEKHDKHDRSSNRDHHKNYESSHEVKEHKHHSRRAKKDDKVKEENDNEIEDVGWEYENKTKVDTRRILMSKPTGKGKRPYMVYLQLTKKSAKAHKYRGWLCGGVIVDRYYVLTSAACVEDADHFYVVSGTTKFVDSFDYKQDDCVCKHRRKVIWKCIPKNYKFDFQDSIKWSSNDIAIVKVDKPFKFGVCEKGCEFATDFICYNNISRDLEKAGTKGYIAGWGSGSDFREGVYRRQKFQPGNAPCLQEAKVCIMDNEQCAKKWSQRFRSIITQYMICTKDIMKRLSEICDKRYANCTDMDFRRDLLLDGSGEAQSTQIDLGRHLRDPYDYTARRSTKQGGFCENDHGGPLIVKYQNRERVIGVISACKIDPKTHSCHGPFLYTSVFKNRQFISCSIFKDVEESCRRVFRSGITHEEWTVNWDHVKEDKDDDNDEDRDDGDDHKAVDSKPAESRSEESKADDSDKESKEALRVKKEKVADKNDKETKKVKQIKEDKIDKEDKSNKRSEKSSSNESSDSESKEKTKHDKLKEEKNKDKHKKKKSKSKSAGRTHDSSKKEEKTSKKSKASAEHSEEPKVKGRVKKEVFYESSKDDNVNEPDDEE